MSITLQMPALSPTMEEGTLAKWLVKVGDSVASGDLLAEIETDKATMEFEAIDEGVIAQLLVAEGTDGVKVGEPIAIIATDGEDAGEVKTAKPAAEPPPAPTPTPAHVEPDDAPQATPSASSAAAQSANEGDRIKASPLARRLAEAQGMDLALLAGSGPGGRIVKADIEAAAGGVATAAAPAPTATAQTPSVRPEPVERQLVQTPAAEAFDIPHSIDKLSNMRKTIARRLTEAKATIPHIYLTLDVRLDALLKLRGELNASLEARGIKLSVNDMLIKALGLALMQVPKCNVSFAGENLISYARADISVAVSIPGGLITPIITDAGGKAISRIATEMADLAARAKDGKLQPHEYQGGTASLSNMGMMGIKQFDAVINPPQAMILAIGAGEKRPYVIEDALQIATVMSVTGSFDHRAIDGADGAALMGAFKALVENPLGLVA